MTNTARPSFFFIEVLRFIAAIAVVGIHVLGPFREQVPLLSFDQWLPAVSLNALSRWAVPIFIMISGALLLSDTRPFDCSRYLQRRVGKVVIPFLGWSLIYALVGGWQEGAWQWQHSVEIIEQSPNHPVWYHLWFFYDFIPLYFVIPLLAPILLKLEPQRVLLLLSAWLVLCLMHWLGVESVLRQNLLLYTGYLILGWYLLNHDQGAYVGMWVKVGLLALVLNVFGSAILVQAKGEYDSLFMGYKSLNTAIIAASLFVTAKYYAEKIQLNWRKPIQVVSKYSFGIYLCHPLLLIPVRHTEYAIYEWFGHPAIAIPAISLIVLFLSLGISMLLTKSRFTAWMVP